MRGFLLDTCVLSEMTKPEPSTAVLGWLDAQDEATLYICTATLAELQRGISRLNAGKYQTYLQNWLQNSVINRFADRTIVLDSEIALNWGTLQAQSAKVGKTMPVLDSLIAATAIAHNLTLVTRNIKDVESSGVKLLNPWI